jgi:hypothetical protein
VGEGGGAVFSRDQGEREHAEKQAATARVPTTHGIRFIIIF